MSQLSCIHTWFILHCCNLFKTWWLGWKATKQPCLLDKIKKQELWEQHLCRPNEAICENLFFTMQVTGILNLWPGDPKINRGPGFSPEGYRMSRPTCVKNCPLFRDMLKNSRHAFSRDATSLFSCCVCGSNQYWPIYTGIFIADTMGHLCQ